MAKINIDGKLFVVTEDIGFQHSMGRFCKMVDDNGVERVAVKIGRNKYRFWTVLDKLGRGDNSDLPPQ